MTFDRVQDPHCWQFNLGHFLRAAKRQKLKRWLFYNHNYTVAISINHPLNIETQQTPAWAGTASLTQGQQAVVHWDIPHGTSRSLSGSSGEKRCWSSQREPWQCVNHCLQMEADWAAPCTGLQVPAREQGRAHPEFHGTSPMETASDSHLSLGF